MLKHDAQALVLELVDVPGSCRKIMELALEYKLPSTELRELICYLRRPHCMCSTTKTDFALHS